MRGPVGLRLLEWGVVLLVLLALLTAVLHYTGGDAAGRGEKRVFLYGEPALVRAGAGYRLEFSIGCSGCRLGRVRVYSGDRVCEAECRGVGESGSWSIYLCTCRIGFMDEGPLVVDTGLGNLTIRSYKP